MLSRQLSTNQKKCTNWDGGDVTIDVEVEYCICQYFFVLKWRSWLFLRFSPFISCILIIVPVPRHQAGNALSSGSLEVTTRGEYWVSTEHCIFHRDTLTNSKQSILLYIPYHIIYLQFTCLDFWWWEIKSQFHYKSFFQESLSFTFSSVSV